MIVERADRAEFSGRLLPIDSVIDARPALSATMLEWLREAAREVSRAVERLAGLR